MPPSTPLVRPSCCSSPAFHCRRSALVVAEFVVHFLLDHAKVLYSGGIDPDEDPQRFWAMHGFDQLLHQLTYIVMVYFALRAVGAGF